MNEIRILSPTAALGYGFPQASFEEGLRRHPHVLAVSAGPRDPDANGLGAGVSFVDQNAVKRDLETILCAGIARGIPIIIGSAIGMGTRPHLDLTADLIREISSHNKLSMRLAVIDSELEKAAVKTALHETRIFPRAGSAPLTARDIETSEHIVAQFGFEPIARALKLDAEVVLAGRACGACAFAAFPVVHGFDVGLSFHLGMVLEKAAFASAPGSDCLQATLRKESFELAFLNPQQMRAVASIVAHSLDHKGDPRDLSGPGVSLDLSEARFETLGDHCVRVRGSRHAETPYAVQLSGAKRVGHRYICVAGANNPVFNAQASSLTQAVRDRTAETFGDPDSKQYKLRFQAYRREDVPGGGDHVDDTAPSDAVVLIEAIAATSDLAKSLCGFARTTMLHLGYSAPGTIAAKPLFAFSPPDFDVGEVFEFSIDHLMQIDDPTSLFPMIIENIGRRKELKQRAGRDASARQALKSGKWRNL
jgi:hypothetical protein